MSHRHEERLNEKSNVSSHTPPSEITRVPWLPGTTPDLVKRTNEPVQAGAFICEISQLADDAFSIALKGF